MKKLIYLLLILSCSLTALAQSNVIPDQEKLLEFYQTQHYTEAAAYLQTIYSSETTNPKEMAQLAYTNMMAGNLPLAESYYLKLYQAQPNSLSVLFSLAGISHRRGDDDKAKSYYQEIIKTDSMNFNVYKQLASMVPNPADPEKIFYLKKANSINPTNPDIAFDLANGLNLSKKNDSAYVVLQPALTADSTNILLLKAKLPICIALQKLDEALVTGEKLLAAGDSSTYVLNNMGKAYLATKQYEKSLRFFKIIEGMGDQNESTLYYTAVCYRELKDYPNAADYFKQSIKEAISPYVSKYYKDLGEIYEKTTQIANADRSYQKSLEFENNGEVYYNLGLLNEFKLNHKKTATLYYKKFLQSKPDTGKYKEVIVYVKDRIISLQK
ncbi:tetratricopeptide repeat protein [Pedobacter sp. L105]|uniref:tetratricopeptide repeat protein n=1 Tax=Pedobacter sp. L105 TaxID=1641871 RepID=UPI00131AF6DD|nr:tetratricopeptide repeat protein [Pedobacter sp. L105]